VFAGALFKSHPFYSEISDELSRGIGGDWDDWTASVFELMCGGDGFQLSSNLKSESGTECLRLGFRIQIDEKNICL
jgi:hypothetical protein